MWENQVKVENDVQKLKKMELRFLAFNFLGNLQQVGITIK